MAIAGSVTAVVNPALVPLAVLGSTAPDWLEWMVNKLGQRVRHRTVTHLSKRLALRALVWAVRLGLPHAITAFCAGGLSHVLCDSLTVQGVPLGWWSDRRFHLFGGRLQTGQPGECVVAGAVVIMCVMIGWYMRDWQEGFFPFFYGWHELYQEGFIDGAEWKANRFRWL